MGGPDERLDELAGRPYQDEGDALAAITEAISIVNGELAAQQARATMAGAEGLAPIGDVIRRWIEKLARMVKAIAEQFEAMTYTIGVNWPLGVSVSISWTPKPAPAAAV
jgi:hypothetical protein